MLRVARKFANTSSLVRDFVFSSLSLDAFFFYASLTKCGPLGSKEIGREKFPIDGAPGAVLFWFFFFPVSRGKRVRTQLVSRAFLFSSSHAKDGADLLIFFPLLLPNAMKMKTTDLQSGGDGIVVVIDSLIATGASVDRARTLGENPLVLERCHWHRFRNDELVRGGHGREERESHRKRGRVEDDAVDGGVHGERRAVNRATGEETGRDEPFEHVVRVQTFDW